MKFTKKIVDQLAKDNNKVVFLKGDNSGIPYHIYKFPLANGEMYELAMPLPVFAMRKWNAREKKMGTRSHYIREDYAVFGELGLKVLELERQFQSAKDSYERKFLKQGIRPYYQVVPSTNTDNEMYFSITDIETETFPSFLQHLLSIPFDERPIFLEDLITLRKKLWTVVLNFFLEDSNTLYKKSQEQILKIQQNLEVIAGYNSQVEAWNNMRMTYYVPLQTDNEFFKFRLSYLNGYFRDKFPKEKQIKLDQVFNSFKDHIDLLLDPSLMVKVGRIVAEVLECEPLKGIFNSERYDKEVVLERDIEKRKTNLQWFYSNFHNAYFYFRAYRYIHGLTKPKPELVTPYIELFCDMVEKADDFANCIERKMKETLIKLEEIFGKEKMKKYLLTETDMLPKIEIVEDHCDCFLKSYIPFTTKYADADYGRSRVKKLKETLMASDILSYEVPKIETYNHSYTFSYRRYTTVNWQKNSSAEYIQSQIWIRDYENNLKEHGELIYV